MQEDHHGAGSQAGLENLRVEACNMGSQPGRKTGHVGQENGNSKGEQGKVHKLEEQELQVLVNCRQKKPDS